WKLENTHVEMKAGSVHLDLLDVTIPEGETAIYIEVKAGDAHIRLPEGVAVDVVGSVKMGDCRVLGQHTSGGGSLVHRSEDYDEAERKLRVRVEVKFGDCHVKQI
ncbi:MAG TPA: cell wall-active antibiotics response protein LiaF, partial [Bacilli bacterium]|nr:cell wall-active antibiotics response protein LiaF [Bacilli bacterium]